MAVLRFDDALRARVADRLERFDRREMPLGERRHAAVAIVLLDSNEAAHGRDDHPWGAESMQDVPGADDLELTGSIAGTAGGPAFVLTRRAPRLSAHAGQWALPGGRVDPGEQPLEAALREVREELGLTLGPDAFVGRLDDYATRSGYVMSPFVLWAGPDARLDPDPAEVQSAHRVSLRELLRPDSPRFVTIPESDRPVVQLRIGGDLIHAPTGAVLLQFRRVALEDRPERVDHLEQPTFAWR